MPKCKHVTLQCPNSTPDSVIPPFHTGTKTRVISGFWYSHGRGNPGFDPGRTRVTDPGAEQGFDPGSRVDYIITVSRVRKDGRGEREAVER